VRNNVQYGLVAIIILLWGCTKSIHSEKEFYNWLNNPDNGLLKEKEIDGIKYTVKYLPVEYLVYQELSKMQNYSKETKDSLIGLYINTRTFLLTIGTTEKSGSGDIMYEGISEMEEFKERVELLNFDMKEYITLKTEVGDLLPRLSTLENTYGLKNSRNVYVVFASDGEFDLMKAQKIDFTFNDEIFNTGINHFLFEREAIDNIPTLKFLKYN
jgi:hypothetical protein